MRKRIWFIGLAVLMGLAGTLILGMWGSILCAQTTEAKSLVSVEVKPLVQTQASAMEDSVALGVYTPTWTTELVDGEGHSMRQSVSLALNAEGEAHVCYHDAYDQSLKYAYLDGTTWYSETVDNSADAGGGCSLALDASSHPHISYYDATNDTIKYAYYNGATWISQTVESVFYVWDQADAMRTSLALDSTGVPHIAYHNYYFGSLKHGWLSGSTWLSETVDSTSDLGHGGTGLYVSLALDGSGDPRISYYDEVKSTLNYARWTGIEWITETVDSSEAVGQYNSLALDNLGNPHISYFDGANGALKYARWTGATWMIETVEAADNLEMGVASSLALDSLGHPHISHYESWFGHATLKYVSWTGSTWESQAVTAAAAFYTSLALDGSDHPHIGYHDNLDGGLHYAWQARRVIVSPVGGAIGPLGSVSFIFPSGAVTATVVITFAALQPTGSQPNAGVFFDITAVFESDGLPAQIAPGQTYTVVVVYDENDLSAGVSESSLALYYWNGSSWLKEPTSVVDPLNNTIIATPDHLSVWAALAYTENVFLPLVLLLQ